MKKVELIFRLQQEIFSSNNLEELTSALHHLFFSQDFS